MPDNLNWTLNAGLTRYLWQEIRAQEESTRSPAYKMRDHVLGQVSGGVSARVRAQMKAGEQ